MTTAAQAQDNFIEANGLRFHYRARGDPGAPGVLILHAITGHSWEWDLLAATLADRFHVLALDQRGHGASAWAPDYAPHHLVEDIAAIVGRLGLDCVRIVGHSMGGINGYFYAARHPASVERLVIIDVGPEARAFGQQVLPAALRAWEQATYAAPEEALAEWLAISPLAREPEMRRYVMPNLRQDDDGQWRWRFDAAGLQSFVNLVPDDVVHWAALRRVSCPTLVIRGAESTALSAPTAARMVQELQRGRLVEISDAGHDVHIDQPEALVAAVRDFLIVS